MPRHARAPGATAALLVGAALLVLGVPPAAAAAPTVDAAAGRAVDGLDAPGAIPGRLVDAAAGRAVDGLDASGAIPGRLVVTVAPQLRSADVAARALDLPGVREARPLGGPSLRIDVAPDAASAVAAALARQPGVLAVEPDLQLRYYAVPDDPLYARQWAHRISGVERAWDRTVGSSALVAVLDSGIDGRHPELAARIVARVDASTGEIRGGAIDNDPCRIGHGTAVAGVLAATGDNRTAVAGVLWDARIVDVSLSSPDTGCGNGPTLSAAVAALHYVASLEPAPVVANLSFGGVTDVCAQAYVTAIEAARSAGIVVVASAGNDQRARPGESETPASCPGVLSVGAIGSSGATATYSQQNPWVDLVAPGGSQSAFASRDERLETEIATTCRTDSTAGGCDGSTTPIVGTSFSSPYVAGVAALVRTSAPDLSLDEVEAVLEGTAQDLGDPGRDDATGWGAVAAGAAVEAAAAGEVPTFRPDPEFPVGGGTDADVAVVRVAAGDRTEAVEQAVAMSRFTFPERAERAVIARADNFADALAGSGLGFGTGPLLFTPPTGPLPAATRGELQRLLGPGATVYVMGGSAAVPAAVDDELRSLGFTPERFAGATREETAALAAPEVLRILRASQIPDLGTVVVTTRADWPDAVAGGSLAAFWGMPILLTPSDALHPATEAALRELAPRDVFVLGGTAAVGDAVAARIAEVTATDPIRLGGATRTGTAVAIARAQELLLLDIFGSPPATAIGVNVRRADGFAHVLSATALAGAQAGVLIPVEGDAGTLLTDDAVTYGCGLPVASAVLAGGGDLLSNDLVDALEEVLEGRAAACTGDGAGR